MSRPLDISGHSFGHLTAISVSHKDVRRIRHWHCRCSCGVELTVAQNNLTSGNSESCGCRHGCPISLPVTRDQLRAVLHYDPATGVFTWRVDGGKNFSVGDVAGHSNHANPYVRISLKKFSYPAHRLAWLYMTGDWAEEVDHRDRDPQNNRWENLRAASRTQNCYNSGIRSHNSNGYKGVEKVGSRYFAKITYNKKVRKLGWFDDPVEAAKAYDAAARDLHGEFACTNFEVS